MNFSFIFVKISTWSIECLCLKPKNYADVSVDTVSPSHRITMKTELYQYKSNCQFWPPNWSPWQNLRYYCLDSPNLWIRFTLINFFGLYEVFLLELDYQFRIGLIKSNISNNWFHNYWVWFWNMVSGFWT